MLICQSSPSLNHDALQRTSLNVAPVRQQTILEAVVKSERLAILQELPQLLETSRMTKGSWKLNVKLLTPENSEELKRDFTGWRTMKLSLSLQQIDYKILSKVVSNQVKSALGLVIHPDQAYAVLGRTISDSLAIFRETIAYVQDVDTCLISLDQEKAFDRISHTYIFISFCDQSELASGSK
eukprot:g34530.t1